MEGSDVDLLGLYTV